MRNGRQRIESDTVMTSTTLRGRRRRKDGPRSGRSNSWPASNSGRRTAAHGPETALGSSGPVYDNPTILGSWPNRGRPPGTFTPSITTRFRARFRHPKAIAVRTGRHWTPPVLGRYHPSTGSRGKERQMPGCMAGRPERPAGRCRTLLQINLHAVAHQRLTECPVTSSPQGEWNSYRRR